MWHRLVSIVLRFVKLLLKKNGIMQKCWRLDIFSENICLMSVRRIKTVPRENGWGPTGMFLSHVWMIHRIKSLKKQNVQYQKTVWFPACYPFFLKKNIIMSAVSSVSSFDTHIKCDIIFCTLSDTVCNIPLTDSSLPDNETERVLNF